MIRKLLNFLRAKRIVYVREVTRPYEISFISRGRFSGQIAFVTGGSGVIGRAICCRLAAEGATVYVGGTKKETIFPVIQEVTMGGGGKASPMIINMLDSKSIASAFKQIIDREGRLDLFVDCAGGGPREQARSVIEQTDEVIDRIIKLNLIGAVYSSREAAKIMSKRGSGRIIFIASVCGVRGLKNYSEYSASKGGVIAFCSSLAMELGEYGVTVNCVSPGIVQRGTIDDLQKERISRTNWLNTYGTPEDIANMVTFLNSEEARFITGQNFIVDGGRSLGLKNS